jgi:hypothetical protein
VMADEKQQKPSLKPATQAWITQFGSQKPLEVRLAQAGQLHDRLIIVEKTNAYDLGQSFNAIATRSPTAISRTDIQTAALKIAAYENIWQAADPL